MSSLELTSESEFSPPRAGRWGRRLRAPWFYSVFRRFRLERIALAMRANPVRFAVLAAFVPGAGFARSWPALARVAVASAFLLVAVVAIWVGRPPSNFALMALVSLHVTSFLFALEPWLQGGSLLKRVCISLMAMVAFWTLLYQPVRGFVEAHILMPVIYGEKVVVMHPAATTFALSRGALVAFTMKTAQMRRENQVAIRGGLNMGVVVGMPRDHIRFAPGVYFLNGRAQRSLPHMPDAGELRLTPEQWCVWPLVTVSGMEYAAPGAVQNALLEQSVMGKDHIKGRVLSRWFWWRQDDVI